MYLQDFAPLFKSRRPPRPPSSSPASAENFALESSTQAATYSWSFIAGGDSKINTSHGQWEVKKFCYTPKSGSTFGRKTLHLKNPWSPRRNPETRKKPTDRPNFCPSLKIQTQQSVRNPTRSKVRAASLAGPWHSWGITQCWVPTNPLPVNHRHTVDGSEILHHLTSMKTTLQDIYDIYHINW